jgi:hypothetical protein
MFSFRFIHKRQNLSPICKSKGTFLWKYFQDIKFSKVFVKTSISAKASVRHIFSQIFWKKIVTRFREKFAQTITVGRCLWKRFWKTEMLEWFRENGKSFSFQPLYRHRHRPYSVHEQSYWHIGVQKAVQKATQNHLWFR